MDDIDQIKNLMINTNIIYSKTVAIKGVKPFAKNNPLTYDLHEKFKEHIKGIGAIWYKNGGVWILPMIQDDIDVMTDFNNFLIKTNNEIDTVIGSKELNIIETQSGCLLPIIKPICNIPNELY